MNEIYAELHSIKANLFVILLVRITSFPYILYICMILEPTINIKQYKYKVNDFYSGEEPIDLTLNLGYAYDFDEKNAKDSEKDKFPYKNKDEFSKDAYKIVKTLKKINYDFSNIKIYSFKADGNNAYEVNIKDLNSIKSEADLNEIIKNVDYSK